MVEVIGALFYLLNKIFFLLRELAGQRGDHEAVRLWKISAWASGLIGLPFVAWILLNERYWIFGWLELGVAPSMILGIVRAYNNTTKPMPRWVDRVVDGAIGFGAGYSACDLGGLWSVTQGLEMVAVVTFLLGRWQLSTKADRNGYIAYLFMFDAAGTLLFIGGYYWFAIQQIASAIIIAYAYHLAGSRKH